MPTLTAIAALVALAGALLLYLGLERSGRGGVPPALLRAFAWAGVAALLVDPGCGGGPVSPTVLLDRSLSMSDPVGEARWRAALDSATRLAAGGPIILFGTTPRLRHESARPDAPASLLLPALRDAASRGGPVVVVTDGEVDDASSLTSDALRGVRVVIVPRPGGRDAGVGALRLPPVLAAGDTAAAEVDVVARQAAPGDSAAVELREEGRPVSRRRVGLGAGAARIRLEFVPAEPAAERSVRRYEARLSGFAGDVEPRNDARLSAAVVTRAASVALLSESPDWDFRWLMRTLGSARAAPVRSFVRTADGPWRDAVTLLPVSDAAVRGAIRNAALVVAHGPEAAVDAVARQARRSVLRWPTGPGALAGDWYVDPGAGGSPLSAALAAVPAESLPPLAALRAARGESAMWAALEARAGRRGEPRPALVGETRDGRRLATVLGSGLWRWASKGGVSAEGYRALVLGLADWLLERRAGGDPELEALRDSLQLGLSELLPRVPALAPQPGSGATRATGRVPLQQRTGVYWAILAALSLEWVLRRRRGSR